MNISKKQVFPSPSFQSHILFLFSFDWKLDVFEESNVTFIDELSASSVHTSDLSDFDEFETTKPTEIIQVKKSSNKKHLSKTKTEIKLRKSVVDTSDSDRSRSTTRRKRSLNPKYYSHEYRNVTKSRSRSSSKSRNSSLTSKLVCYQLI
jgi:hypothetical protein